MKKISILYLVGYLAYQALEVLTGTITDPLGSKSFIGLFFMGILGGFLFLFLGLLNEYKRIKNLPVIAQSLIGASLITIAELLAGLILNKVFGLNVWDYSHLPFNFYGQICLLFSFFWFLLSPFAFWLDDVLRWVFYKTGCSLEKKPYNLLWIYQRMFLLK